MMHPRNAPVVADATHDKVATMTANESEKAANAKLERVSVARRRRQPGLEGGGTARRAHVSGHEIEKRGSSSSFEARKRRPIGVIQFSPTSCDLLAVRLSHDPEFLSLERLFDRHAS